MLSVNKKDAFLWIIDFIFFTQTNKFQKCLILILSKYGIFVSSLALERSKRSILQKFWFFKPQPFCLVFLMFNQAMINSLAQARKCKTNRFSIICLNPTFCRHLFFWINSFFCALILCGLFPFLGVKSLLLVVKSLLFGFQKGVFESRINALKKLFIFKINCFIFHHQNRQFFIILFIPKISCSFGYKQFRVYYFFFLFCDLLASHQSKCIRSRSCLVEKYSRSCIQFGQDGWHRSQHSYISKHAFYKITFQNPFWKKQQNT